MYEKFYVHEKILRTRNCRRRFIKNLLPEKRKENMETKQPRFKSRFNNTKHHRLRQISQFFKKYLFVKSIYLPFLTPTQQILIVVEQGGGKV